ncbi:MAG: RNA polymerase sigma factor [Gemmatimonadota bacterium]
MTETEAVLVERTRAGDARAFEELVNRHYDTAYGVALSRVIEPADAEDVCQEAFIRALERIDDLRDPAAFRAWLLEIVRNRALNLRRHRAVRKAVPLETVDPASDRPEASVEVERAELRARLLGAMEGLTPLQREVLLLFDLEGWSHREIAGKLDISEGSARVHLHNARRVMRERLAEGEAP